MSAGFFITFEGIEGSGKTTQIVQLAEHLKAARRAVTVTREPGGTNVGAAIRAILLDPGFSEMDYHTEVLLYAADRAQHVAEVIRPALARGDIVISDRYIDSSIAYQHYGRGLPLDLIVDVNEHAVQGLKPSLTILIDVPTAVGLKRATEIETDRIERESVDFHDRVAAGFAQLAADEPERWRVIDGTRSIDEVHRDVVAAISAIAPAMI
ncbi:MAG: dTMP kinase [Actinobacteria bacterium]|nr:dTMP kinase [Actinomycetota bacterium]